jgi:3-hydroxyisobutyrate dehydrogenase-like beta-hydroxyacid dehydrogenase
VWNRTADRAARLVERGARGAATPREAAAAADVTVVMVSTPDAFEAVLTGPHGIAAGLREGSVLVDMGTDGVPAARRAAALAASRGAAFVDAPVLGSRIPATQGKLVVMAGGDPRDFDRVRPILECTAASVHHVGPVGAGQSMKLAANLVLSHLLSGLAGSVALAEAAGLRGSDLVDVLEAGLRSPYFRVKGDQMVKGDFAPHFALDLVRKDLRLIRAALDQAGVPVPSVGPILGMFDEAARRGWGEEDCAAVVKILRPGDPA